MFIDGWASWGTLSVGVTISVEPDHTAGWGLIIAVGFGPVGFEVGFGVPTQTPEEERLQEVLQKAVDDLEDDA